jgi:steroid delta-isomerase-like uncharacterized protein
MPTPAQLIQAYVDAFNQDDLEGQLAVLSDDIVHGINESETQVGIDTYRAFKLHMDSHYRERLNDVVVFENGHRGAVEFIVDGTYIQKDGDLPDANDQTYSIRAAFFADTNGEKITRITSYYNLKKWCEVIESQG